MNKQQVLQFIEKKLNYVYSNLPTVTTPVLYFLRSREGVQFIADLLLEFEVEDNPIEFNNKSEEQIPFNETLIESLNLSARTLTCLKSRKIETINQLCEYTESSLLCIPKFGFISLREVRDALGKIGLKLKGN